MHFKLAYFLLSFFSPFGTLSWQIRLQLYICTRALFAQKSGFVKNMVLAIVHTRLGITNRACLILSVENRHSQELAET